MIPKEGRKEGEEEEDAATHGVRHTGQGEARGELHDILLELLDELRGLAAAVLVRVDKVGELLGAGLLLGDEGDLDDAVEELGNFLHGARSVKSGQEQDGAIAIETWTRLDIGLLHRSAGKG
jgi:hypothetical protein